MRGPGIDLDHIGIVAPDLALLEQRYRNLGFLVAPRCELVRLKEDGTSEPMGQVNSHLVFAGSYVELTAVTGDIAGHHLEQALSRYWGFHIVALLAGDASSQRSRLLDAGLAIGEAGIAGRTIDYPSGRGMGRFRWFRIPDADAPEAFFCFVQHLTPDLVFDPELNRHPNGADDLTGITLCVADPGDSARRLAAICGAKARAGEDGFELALGSATIRLVDAGAMSSLYGNIALPPLPFAAAFRVHTKSLDDTATYFARAGIDVRTAGDLLVLPPAQEGDPVIEFES